MEAGNMTESTLAEEVIGVTELDSSRLITEDDQPVDSVCSEKQMRLLTETLYISWGASPFVWA
jgi:hypothetical protein